ncbi:Two-component signal transduction system YycFG, regulatory protein YycH [Amphibacillus marinus]|uniref:Two-component signal transduction system YycFG, regulatory protein YycH n=1 Tax=Amphibacillus marinus TaxID=872970 RepID=A0A1H8PK81_9BACI|nr:two-component system activity regulator YycH [Amphibacillus marinus]SEO42196.1 Two-component signal transduction system YycFG, regulatory protein YycH [Amphibacillus marinus]
MNVEHFKSILLVLLIASSLLLTVALWNHQPNFEAVVTDNDLIEAQIQDGGQLSRRDVIQPIQIVNYQAETGELLGLANLGLQEELLEEIKELSLYNFSSFSMNQQQEQTENRIELIFPTTLPYNAIYDVFQLDHDVPIAELSFNHIDIVASDDPYLLFYNDRDEESRVIRANIQNENQVDRIFRYYNQHDVTTFLTYESSRETNIYLPNEIDREVLLFTYRSLEQETFTNILFSKPSIVRRVQSSQGQVDLFDGTREMTVEEEKIAFTNLTNEEIVSTTLMDSYNLFDQVQSFVNEHNGFTYEEPFSFYLSNITNNMQRSEVEYTLSYSGVPIFQDTDISTIKVAWHNQSVYQYQHPLAKLLRLRSSTEMADIPSAEQVIEILAGETYEGIAVYDVLLGYYVNRRSGSEGQIYELVPTWYVRGVQGWSPLSIPDKTIGGEGIAMGTN